MIRSGCAGCGWVDVLDDDGDPFAWIEEHTASPLHALGVELRVLARFVL